MDQINPVILCGGSGSRLWPLSRKSFPKQFVRLTEEHSLFQLCAERVSGKPFAPPIILTTNDYRFLVLEQLAAQEIAPRDVLIEPSPKNTAAAICTAAIALEEKEPGSMMLILPSDHLIPDVKEFQNVLNTGVPFAKQGYIVTLGIEPTYAETGYGWLHLEDSVDQLQPNAPHKIISFTEKPNKEKAEELLKGGMHLWNAGIFMFTSSTILEAFKQYSPEIFYGCEEAYEGKQCDLCFTRLDTEAWRRLPDVSIDYAVMENADNIVGLPYAGSWSDLGDWSSVWKNSDIAENGLVTSGLVTAIDCQNSFIKASSDEQCVVGIGLKNLIAVAMPDAVLIADKEHAQDVKAAVIELKSQSIPQAEQFLRDYRPWGWYERLAIGSRFQVKKIMVKPGASLSLQSHNHRSEHWIVVEGTAKVTIGDNVSTLTENESVYVPLGEIHRLENPGKLPVIMIEVQTGSYLGEDDITRFEDLYARN